MSLLGASGACGSGCWMMGCETGLSGSLLSEAGSTSVDEGVTSSSAGQTSTRHLVKTSRSEDRKKKSRINTDSEGHSSSGGREGLHAFISSTNVSHVEVDMLYWLFPLFLQV